MRAVPPFSFLLSPFSFLPFGSPHALPSRMPDPYAPSRRHQLGLVLAVGSGVALVAAVVAGLGADEGWPVDHRVRRALAGRRHPRIRAAMRIAGVPGTVGFYAPAT